MKNIFSKFIKFPLRPFFFHFRLIFREQINTAHENKRHEIHNIVRDEINSNTAKDKSKVKQPYYKYANKDDKIMAKLSPIDMHPRHVVLVALEYLMDRCSERRLLIYGTGVEAQKINSFLLSKDIEIDYFIDDKLAGSIFEDKDVRSYYDVAYEDKNSIFIIVADENESYDIARQKLISFDLIEDIDFTYFKDIPMFGGGNYYYDVTLSFNRIRNEIEGFEIFGDLNNLNALKIVALGGSTTESAYKFAKGWAYFLAKLLLDKGIPAVIYCGGLSGYTSSQELLKLIRDVLPLNPDIILSYSGVNDLLKNILPDNPEKRGRPFINDFQIKFMNKVMKQYPEESRTVYYGLKNHKSAADLWLDNTRSMYAIAKEFNILFLSFLQPFLYIGNYTITDSQKIIFKRWFNNDYPMHPIYCGERLNMVIEGAHRLMNDIKNLDYITDLTHIFSECTNIYMDAYHVYEEGNKIIAKHIFGELLKHLDKLEKATNK